MRIDPTVVSAEIPDTVRRLFAMAPPALWWHRAHALAERERHNPFLADYLNARFSLERALVAALLHRRNTGRYPTITGPAQARIYELYSFASALV